MLVYPHATSSQLLFDHVLAPVQTVYGLSKFYAAYEEDFYVLQPGLEKGYDPGDVVTVPIPTTVIRREVPADSLAWFVPVRYRMQDGETLFGLATRRLGWLNTAPLLRLNPGLEAARMKPGAIINIGYMTVAGLPPNEDGYLDPFSAKNRGLRRMWELRTAGKEMEEESGKAAWLKKGDDQFLVLHRTAPRNSIIELTDPRSRKTMYARVAGPIPEQVHDLDVMVVVSKMVAQAFGVRDKKFYIKTRHF